MQEPEDFDRLGRDTARLPGPPLACIHTPADDYVAEGIRPVLAAARPETVGEVVDASMSSVEFQSVARDVGALPAPMSGTPEWPAGRIMVKGGAAASGPRTPTRCSARPA